MQQEIIRVALAGLGRIGWMLEDDPLREKPATHAGAVSAVGGVELVAGADPDPARCEGFRRRWDCSAVFRSCREMVAAVHPDLLIVASPPETHPELVEQAAAAGVQVIICEKPLAVDTAAAGRMVRVCEAAGTRLLVNHERRYSADYLYAEELIRAQKYGRLLSLQARVYMGRQRTPLQILYDDGTHMLDMIRMLAGYPLQLQGCFGAGDLPGETLQLILRAPEAPVYLEVGAGREQLEFELELSWERGRLRIGNGVLEEAVSAPSRWYSGFHSLEPVPVPEFADKGYFAGMIRDAAACVRDPSRRPRSAGTDGLAVVRLMDSIKEAVRNS